MSEFKGVVTHIGYEEKFGEKFSKQVVRLEEVSDKEYPASLVVDFNNDKRDLIKQFVVGDVITAYINFKTNESKKEPGKFFNSIICRKVKNDKPAEASWDLPF